MLDKEKVFALVVREVEREFDTLAEAARESREAATNEESKPENKYDTRGLEASYLASAQAQRAAEISKDLETLRRIELKAFNESSVIAAGALVKLNSGEADRYVLALPIGGGVKVSLDNIYVQTISPNSPLGQEVFGRRCGDFFEIEVKGQRLEYEIVEVN